MAMVWSEMGEGTSVCGVWASKCSTMLMCFSMWAPLNVEDNVGPPLTSIFDSQNAWVLIHLVATLFLYPTITIHDSCCFIFLICGVMV